MINWEESTKIVASCSVGPFPRQPAPPYVYWISEITFETVNSCGVGVGCGVSDTVGKDETQITLPKLVPNRLKNNDTMKNATGSNTIASITFALVGLKNIFIYSLW